MKFISLIVYIIVQILFIPLTIIGVILIVVKQFIVSRYLKISSTAVDVVSVRWAMDIFDIKKDSVSRKLFRYLPNASLLGYWLVMYPAYLRYKMSKQYHGFYSSKEAGREFFGNPITNRTLYIDKYIKSHQNDAQQLVILGAGFDTRCYEDLSGNCPHLYEIDLANTQRIKKETLKKANIDSSRVKFVTANLTKENWVPRLIKSGFDPKLKTVFLMEGITVYLDEKNVLNILKKISEISVKDSAILVDFYSTKFVGLSILPDKSEGYKFGLELCDSNNFVDFIEKTGLILGKHNYLGQHSNNGPFMVTAELLVK